MRCDVCGKETQPSESYYHPSGRLVCGQDCGRIAYAVAAVEMRLPEMSRALQDLVMYIQTYEIRVHVSQ